MRGSEILDLLDEIAANPSKHAKEMLLTANIGDERLRRVLRAAYDPFITYGIIPNKPTVTGPLDWDGASDERIFIALGDLATREVTGGDAGRMVESLFRDLEPKSAELLWRVLCKDLRAGFTEGTINRVKPGLIPVFDVMLAHKYEEKRIKSWPVAGEPKHDGVRVIAMVKNGQCEFVSRNGKPFPALDFMRDAVVTMVNNAWSWQSARTDRLTWRLLGDFDGPAVVLDGEMVSGSFNKTSGDVRRKSAQAIDAKFIVFTALPLVPFLNQPSVDMDYMAQRRLLMALMDHAPAGIEPIETRQMNSHDDLIAFYNEVRAGGGEGLIVKPLPGIYEKKRSHAWLKMKAEETIDVPIVGAFEGQGKYEGTLGGLIVDVEGVHVRVGGGISDKQRDEFWEARPELVGRLIEVEYHEKTPDGSLRHPRFVRFRDDKAA